VEIPTKCCTKPDWQKHFDFVGTWELLLVVDVVREFKGGDVMGLFACRDVVDSEH
jgi:hypothetical protein